MPFANALPDTRLILDTCTLTDWRYKKPAICARINDYIREHGEAPALSSLTVFEALQGFEKKFYESGTMTERDRIDLKATQMLIDQAAEISTFGGRAAAIAAYVFPRLTQAQRNVHWRDVFIAATAVANGYGVATSDRGFELIGSKLSIDHPTLYLALWK